MVAARMRTWRARCHSRARATTPALSGPRSTRSPSRITVVSRRRAGGVVGLDRRDQGFEQVEPAVDVAHRIDALARRHRGRADARSRRARTVCEWFSAWRRKLDSRRRSLQAMSASAAATEPAFLTRRLMWCAKHHTVRRHVGTLIAISLVQCSKNVQLGNRVRENAGPANEAGPRNRRWDEAYFNRN